MFDIIIKKSCIFFVNFFLSTFSFCNFVAVNFAKRHRGEMSEWLKEHAWKACIRQKCIGGSNPPLSAI